MYTRVLLVDRTGHAIPAEHHIVIIVEISSSGTTTAAHNYLAVRVQLDHLGPLGVVHLGAVAMRERRVAVHSIRPADHTVVQRVPVHQVARRGLDDGRRLVRFVQQVRAHLHAVIVMQVVILIACLLLLLMNISGGRVFFGGRGRRGRRFGITVFVYCSIGSAVRHQVNTVQCDVH